MPDVGPVPRVILHVIRSLPTQPSRSLSVFQMHISWATGHAQCRLALNPSCCSPALTCGCMAGVFGHSQIINLTRMLFLVLVTVACEPIIQPTASTLLRECAGLLFEGQRGQAAGMHQGLYTSGSHLEHSRCVASICIPRVSKIVHPTHPTPTPTVCIVLLSFSLFLSSPLSVQFFSTFCLLPNNTGSWMTLSPDSNALAFTRTTPFRIQHH